MRLCRSNLIMILLVPALGVLAASCSTMAASENARQARLSQKKDAPAPSASPATPGSNETGSLLQRRKESLKYDPETAALEKSVDKALATRVDLNTTDSLAPGPVVPRLKQRLETPKDLELALTAWDAYAEATWNVMVSLRAWGLKKNIAAVQAVVQAGAVWKDWFATMEVDCLAPGMDVARLETFFRGLGRSRATADKAVEGINAYLDRQRTRPAPASLTSP